MIKIPCIDTGNNSIIILSLITAQLFFPVVIVVIPDTKLMFFYYWPPIKYRSTMSQKFDYHKVYQQKIPLENRQYMLPAVIQLILWVLICKQFLNLQYISMTIVCICPCKQLLHEVPCQIQAELAGEIFAIMITQQ